MIKIVLFVKFTKLFVICWFEIIKKFVCVTYVQKCHSAAGIFGIFSLPLTTKCIPCEGKPARSRVVFLGKSLYRILLFFCCGQVMALHIFWQPSLTKNLQKNHMPLHVNEQMFGNVKFIPK